MPLTVAAVPRPLCRPAPPSLRVLDQNPPPDELFGKLVTLYQQNRALLRQLDQARGALREAVDYAARPDANRLLAEARLEQVQDRRRQILAQLRANRLTARRLLIP
jgi:hypothetical protein